MCIYDDLQVAPLTCEKHVTSLYIPYSLFHSTCYFLGQSVVGERNGFLLKPIRSVEPVKICKAEMDAMEVYGKSMVAVPTNIIYLSSILGQDGSNPNANPIHAHKCDWKCENEHVCGNMFLCKLTGLTHICDKNCNQRIVYDNNNSLCRVSRQIFPLTASEVQAVKGVRRKLEEESSESCAFKRRRNGQFYPSPFERSFTTVAPICSQVGDGMDIN